MLKGTQIFLSFSQLYKVSFVHYFCYVCPMKSPSQTRTFFSRQNRMRTKLLFYLSLFSLISAVGGINSSLLKPKPFFIRIITVVFLMSCKHANTIRANIEKKEQNRQKRTQSLLTTQRSLPVRGEQQTSTLKYNSIKSATI